MQEIKDPNKKQPIKKMVYYYILMLVIILLLNIFVFPSMLSKQVTEVSYNEFLTMVDNQEVSEVSYQESESRLIFTAGEGDDVKYYETRVFNS